MLVQQARIGEKWIACDCLQSGESPPILTPAFLSQAETYYLRRLTSTDRPQHHPARPFFREHSTHSLTAATPTASAPDPPRGYFELISPPPAPTATTAAETHTNKPSQTGPAHNT